MCITTQARQWEGAHLEETIGTAALPKIGDRRTTIYEEEQI